MIEIIFTIGLASQMTLMLGSAGFGKKTVPMLQLPLLALAIGGLFIGLQWYLGPGYSPLAEAVLSFGMLIGGLFAITWGFLSLQVAQKMRPFPFIILHGIALAVWYLHPEFHNVFVWNTLLPLMTPVVLSSVITPLRRDTVLGSIYYGWYLALLVFFSIQFFLPLTEVFEPSYVEAFVLGGIFAPLFSYGLFTAKYVIMVIMAIGTTRGRSLMATFQSVAMAPTLMSWKDLPLLLSLIVLVAVHLVVPATSLETSLRLLLLLCLVAQDPLSAKDRKKVIQKV